MSHYYYKYWNRGAAEKQVLVVQRILSLTKPYVTDLISLIEQIKWANIFWWKKLGAFACFEYKMFRKVMSCVVSFEKLNPDLDLPCLLFCLQIFNPLYTVGLFHCYMLDKSNLLF